MKKTKLLMPLMLIGTLVLMAACGGEAKKEKVELSEKGDLLCSISWKLDPNATLKGTTDAIEDTSGIIADIELKGDIKKLADFAAETLTFGIDDNDPSKLSYSSKIGEGFLSATTLGYWEFDEKESAVIMKEWDKEAGKEKAPVTYQIVELTKEKLVLQKEGGASPKIYFPKK